MTARAVLLCVVAVSVLGGCSVWRGIQDQLIEKKHPAREEIERVAAEIVALRTRYSQARDAYDAAVDAYNRLVERGSGDARALAELLARVEQLADAMQAAWRDLQKALESSRAIVVKYQEETGGAGYAIGGLIGGILATLGAQFATRRVSKGGRIA